MMKHAVVTAMLWLSFVHGHALAQIRPFKTSGTVKSLARGTILIEDRSGKSRPYYFASSDGIVRLKQNRKFSSGRPIIEVSGSLNKTALKKDMAVRLECFVAENGRVRTPVDEVRWVDEKSLKPGTQLDRKTTNDRNETRCAVSGSIDRVDPGGFMIRMPRSRLASGGLMPIPLSPEVKVLVKERSLSKVSSGDRVTNAEGVMLATGEYVIRKLEIQLQNKGPEGGEEKNKTASKSKVSTSESALAGKYAQYSDEPAKPRLVSKGVIKMRSDASDRDVQRLLDEANELARLLVGYYRRPIATPLECTVVHDLKQWSSSALPAEMKEAIEAGRGLTKAAQGTKPGKPGKARIYCANQIALLRGEIVRSYCLQSFGGVGPQWYSRGMMELGKSWKQLATEVDVDSNYLSLLQARKEPRSLKEVLSEVKREESESTSTGRTGNPKVPVQRRSKKQRSDLPAHRWALCYMLSHNPNYNRKFLDLGLGMMSGRQNASLKSSYGKVSRQLLFEYQQFLKNVENGYDAKLCAWKWSHRFQSVPKSDPIRVSVVASRGWQPGVLVEEGQRYELTARGKWKIDGSGTSTTANGMEDGVGRLVGVIMNKYQLDEPFPIGERTVFRAPKNGQLYLRCSEHWGGLGDNSGAVTCSIQIQY